jgi:hypothetical protein
MSPPTFTESSTDNLLSLDHDTLLQRAKDIIAGRNPIPEVVWPDVLVKVIDSVTPEGESVDWESIGWMADDYWMRHDYLGLPVLCFSTREPKRLIPIGVAEEQFYFLRDHLSWEEFSKTSLHDNQDPAADLSMRSGGL